MKQQHALLQVDAACKPTQCVEVDQQQPWGCFPLLQQCLLACQDDVVLSTGDALVWLHRC